jgi:hypothetical protein
MGTGTVAVQGVSTNIVTGTAQNSTSGTSIDFPSIPSWVRRITINFYENSTNGSSNRLVQIGTSSGITTSGYLSSGGYGGGATSSTTGFLIWIDSASYALTGQMVLTLLTNNTWISSHTGRVSNGQCAFGGGSSSSLGAALDRIRITTVNGTDVFDGGTINIMYE